LLTAQLLVTSDSLDIIVIDGHYEYMTNFMVTGGEMYAEVVGVTSIEGFLVCTVNLTATC